MVGFCAEKEWNFTPNAFNISELEESLMNNNVSYYFDIYYLWLVLDFVKPVITLKTCAVSLQATPSQNFHYEKTYNMLHLLWGEGGD